MATSTGQNCSGHLWCHKWLYMCKETSVKNYLRRSVFTARRVCIAHIMPWQDVCPSVCLSHAGILSKRLYIGLSSNFFPPPGSPTILVFPYQIGWQCSDRDPPNGGVECKGVWKNHDFRPIYRFILETMLDRAIVTM